MKRRPLFSHIGAPNLGHSTPHTSFSASRVFCRVQNWARLVSDTALIFIMLPLMSTLMGANTGDPRQQKKGSRWDTASRKGQVSICLSVGGGFNRCHFRVEAHGDTPACRASRSALAWSLPPATDSGDASVRLFLLNQVGHLALAEREEERPQKGPPKAGAQFWLSYPG